MSLNQEEEEEEEEEDQQQQQREQNKTNGRTNKNPLKRIQLVF